MVGVLVGVVLVIVEGWNVGNCVELCSGIDVFGSDIVGECWVLVG